MKSVAFQRFEVTDQKLFLRAEHLNALTVFRCNSLVLKSEADRLLSNLHCVDSGTFDREDKRDHFVSENHQVEVYAATRNACKGLHRLKAGIMNQRGKILIQLVRCSFEVPHQMLSQRENCVDTIDTSASFLPLHQRNFMTLLPGRHGNSHRNGQQGTQRLHPTRSIGRQPTMLYPVGNRAHQQPQHATHGQKHQQENNSLLDKPIFLISHSGQHFLKGKKPSLPTAASLVYGRAA